MVLYHGTTPTRAECIEEEGFRGGEISEITDGFTLMGDGVIYVTDSKEEAAEYGECVFEIEMLNVQPTYFQDAPYSDAKEYYIKATDLNSGGIWRLIK